MSRVLRKALHSEVCSLLCLPRKFSSDLRFTICLAFKGSHLKVCVTVISPYVRTSRLNSYQSRIKSKGILDFSFRGQESLLRRLARWGSMCKRQLFAFPWLRCKGAAKSPPPRHLTPTHRLCNPAPTVSDLRRKNLNKDSDCTPHKACKPRDLPGYVAPTSAASVVLAIDHMMPQFPAVVGLSVANDERSAQRRVTASVESASTNGTKRLV